MNSRDLFTRSLKTVPGGVHSPVRSFKGLHTTPRFIQRGEGARIWDVEGRDYIDFCMSFGPLILGHRNPIVKRELERALERGWSYGACEPYSLELVEYLLGRLSFIEQIRFLNSGTEAVMTALRLARGVTGRNKIIKFGGCYHGHADSVLMKAGSGVAALSEASSAGVPEGVSDDTIVLTLGDREGVERYFCDCGQDIAAVIIEPLPANNGLLVQEESFFHFLREITKENQSLLIFDEVISGFRVAFGGMVERLGIVPDIVTYGKIIGGGLPVGAVASRSEIMEFLAPAGEVYQAGTLSANPLAMVAGKATLSQLTPDLYPLLEERTQKIVDIFKRWLGGDISVEQSSSLFWFSMEEDRFPAVFKQLLERGIYLAPSACEVGFVSLAHDDKIIEELERRLWN